MISFIDRIKNLGGKVKIRGNEKGVQVKIEGVAFLIAKPILDQHFSFSTPISINERTKKFVWQIL